MIEEAYDLEEAYQINGPEDARRMYGDWAETYDESFGAAWGPRFWTSAPAPDWWPNTCAG